MTDDHAAGLSKDKSVHVAALYRVSSAKQLKEGEDVSIPVQASIIREYVSKHPGWQLVEEYFEEGVSAYKYSKDDRDIIRKALADAAAEKFKVLLVFKADRLSRKSFEYPLMLWQFHSFGVEVIAVADAPGGRVLKIEDQFDKLVRFVEGWQAETESKNTSIRVSNAMKELARKGHWSGGRPPYGFRLNRNKDGLSLEIDENEKAVIQMMVQMYEEGMGSKRIAGALNARGIFTREGRPWTDSRVRQVLQNPIIAGLPAYGRTRPGGTPNSRVRIEGYTDINNFIVPRDEKGNPRPVQEYEIIPFDRWQKVIDRMKSAQLFGDRKVNRAKVMQSSYLLTGFLVCGHCGRGFSGTVKNRKRVLKNGEVRTYRSKKYRCSSFTRVGKGRMFCDGQSSYSQDRVDQVFLAELGNFLKSINPNDFESYIEQRQGGRLAGISSELKLLEQELKKRRKIYSEWVTRLDAYFADPANSLYTEELIASKIKEHEAACRQLEEKVNRLKSEMEAMRHRRSQLKEFSKKVPSWLETFNNAPVPVKKKMLSHIIDKVYLYRDRMEIHYSVDVEEFLGSRSSSERIELRVMAVL